MLYSFVRYVRSLCPINTKENGMNSRKAVGGRSVAFLRPTRMDEPPKDKGDASVNVPKPRAWTLSVGGERNRRVTKVRGQDGEYRK